MKNISTHLINKHLLLDTNLLIKLKDHLKDHFFHDFIQTLEATYVKAAIEEATKFEFLRGATTQNHLIDKENFLDFLLGGEKNRMILPLTPEILENSKQLANIYSNKNPNLSKQISVTDCLIAAQLMKYGGELLLATLDNNDFPLFIFDRLDIFTIDTEKEILNIGFYQFNQAKYEKCRADFNKTKE